MFQKTRLNWEEEIPKLLLNADFKTLSANQIQAFWEKLSTPLFAVSIRLGVSCSSENKQRSWDILRRIGANLSQFAAPSGNELIALSSDGLSDNNHFLSLLNRTSYRSGMLLNVSELAALAHFPANSVRIEKLKRNELKTKPAPGLALNHRLILGENIHQQKVCRATLSNDQRTKHLHLIGSSGSGKSTLMLNLIKQDLENDQGLCTIEPHGDLIDFIIENVPEARLKDVILFDPSDAEFPVGFNILQANSEVEKNLLSSDLVATFRRMATSWGDVMDSVLANAILAFVESSRGGTLFELRRFLVEKDFRAEFLTTVQDESVKYFWEQEFPQLSGKPQSSILIRLDSFLRNRMIRNIVCQKQTKLNFREIMDNKKILLIKLSQGLIGEENAYLLGTLLVSKLYQIALSRQDSTNRPYFWIYLDEFQHFITPSMESILSGVRKYNIGLHLAHQEFRQLQSRSLEVASSVLSNCYTRICFRLGDNDAEKFANGFSFFDAKALQNLSVGEAIARVERAEYDFNLKTPPVPKVNKETADKRTLAIIEQTRKNYASPKNEVEAQIFPKQNFIPDEPVSESSASKPPTKIPTGETIIETLTPPPVSITNNEQIISPLPLDLRAAPSIEKNSQHRYLQSLVKRMAESKGFLATLEKQVLGGAGKIDVALERDNLKIACEISVTNEPDYELNNIQKCLLTGYSPVILISADKRHLEKIRKITIENVPPEELEKVEFFTPEEFYAWFEKLENDAGQTEERVKGFRVKVRLKPVEEADRSTRQKAISDVVFGGLKNVKKGDHEE